MDARLGPGAIALYKLALADPRWTREDAMERLGVPSEALDVRIATLCALRLLRSSPDSDREFDAVSPETAATELLCDEQQDMLHRQRALAAMREDLLSLLPAYFDAHRRRGASEHFTVVGHEAVGEIMESQITDATREISVTFPFSGAEEAGPDPYGLVESLKLRGQDVETHLLVQESRRWSDPALRRMARAGESGVRVRTVSCVDQSLMVFDAETALVVKRGVEHTAMLVREPTIVGLVSDFFGSLWQRGNPFPVDGSESGDEARRDLSRAILEEMAAGFKDEMIARRLGISLRTCRRHVAALLDELGARSRFQAGVLAYRRGLLE